MKKVYICEDTIRGIFSAVHDAWKERPLEKEVGIALRGRVEAELFAEYIETEASERKELLVERMIRKNLGDEAGYHFYQALLSDDDGKADAVLGAMLAAREIRNPSRIMEHLGHPKVRKVFELSRTVGNEAHYFKEFLRFRELENGVLLAEIEPKAQVLTCIAEHFSNRFPLENFMIYDRTHKLFLVHQAQKRWAIASGEELNMEYANRVSAEERTYAALWKGFTESICIEERRNTKMQRQNLPIHFRKDMVEFQQ